MWSNVIHLLGEVLSKQKELAQLVTYCMLACGVITFILLSAGVRAAYGRYSHEAICTKFVLPARTAWVLQEIPSFLIPMYYVLTSYHSLHSHNFLVVSLFILHYAQRSLIYSFRIEGGKPTPVHLFLMAFLFCSGNGFIQGVWHTRYVVYPTRWIYDPITLLGIALFVVGAVVNMHSDWVLRHLRRSGEKGYKIPRGGMFEYVSSANYFGECVEWIGYAIAARTLPSFAFAFFTVCNLGPRAVNHHRWYQQKFEDYPRARKALIPFVL